MKHRSARGCIVIAILVLSIAPAAHAASAPRTGVYGCYDATMDFPGRLSITPMPFVMFGLLDQSTYADYDGHKGHYTWNEGTGMLTMADGSREGWRYHKVGDWSFRMIDNRNGKETYTCPLNAGKDPKQRPW